MRALAFGGLDTLLVVAGVSALQPLITGVANTPRDDQGRFGAHVPIKMDVQRAKDVASRAMGGNFLGPLVAAVTFVSLGNTTTPHNLIMFTRFLCSKILLGVQLYSSCRQLQV